MDIPEVERRAVVPTVAGLEAAWLVVAGMAVLLEVAEQEATRVEGAMVVAEGAEGQEEEAKGGREDHRAQPWPSWLLRGLPCLARSLP